MGKSLEERWKYNKEVECESERKEFSECLINQGKRAKK